MRLASLGRWLLAGGLVGAGAVALGRRRRNRATTRRVEALRSAADRPDTVHAEFDDLPDPVARYFDAVLGDERAPVRAARLEQDGEFRLGGRDGDWRAMRATQHYTVDPPGFLWDARIAVAPLLSARVVDAYEFGEGSLRATVLGAVPVATATPGPELNEAELQRYLAEAVWFPTALLPGAGVSWEGIDERSARATLTDGGATASLAFHFDGADLVERVTAAQRWRQESGDHAPWTGQFERYEWHDGLRIPTEASVAWDLPDGPLPYWQAVITDVEYDRSRGR